jgi:hypothetical protein
MAMRFRTAALGMAASMGCTVAIASADVPSGADSNRRQAERFVELADYEQAAERFERYARADAQAGDAAGSLANAFFLRLGLGQEREAIKDADELIRAHGGSKAAIAGSVAVAMGAHHAEKEEWERARLALTSGHARAAIDRAPVDIQVQAHLTLGRALAHLGPARAVDARTEYARVRSLWSDPVAAEQGIRAAYGSEDAAKRQRRVDLTVKAVSEALVFAADQRKASEVDSLRLPEYKGPGDKASVQAHVQTKVKDWYSRKMEAIHRVEAEYAKLLELVPRPDPGWVIAATARVGLMWADFVDEQRRIPSIPSTRHIAVCEPGAEDPSARFLVQHARPAVQKCLDLSTQHRHFDSFSRSCEVWLAKQYTWEYHVLDELRPAPTLASRGLDERTLPALLVDASLRPQP